MNSDRLRQSQALKDSGSVTQSRGREPALNPCPSCIRPPGSHFPTSRRAPAAGRAPTSGRAPAVGRAPTSSRTPSSGRGAQAHGCGSEWPPETPALRHRASPRLAPALLVAALLAVSVLAAVAGAQEDGKILRPIDGAALAGDTVDIIATAPAGRLELDGKPAQAAEPFPNVFHATATVAAGEHRLALIWEGGRQEIRFFSGANPPAPFKAFRQHPPLAAVECTQCHGVSRRGRFRFEGGCFACHVEDNFTKTHPHPVHVLQECGLCHNAHGSTEKGLLLYPKEKACKLCHG